MMLRATPGKVRSVFTGAVESHSRTSEPSKAKRVRESGYKPSWRETAELIQRDVFDAWQPDMGGPFTFKLYRNNVNTASLDGLSFVEAVALFWDYAKECWEEGKYLTIWGADGEATSADFHTDDGVNRVALDILSAKYESPRYRGESRKRVRESSGWVEPDNPDDTYSLDALAYVQREGFLDYQYKALVAYSYELGALNPNASAGTFLSEMNLYYHEDKELMIAAFLAGQRGVSESRKRQPRSKRSK